MKTRWERVKDWMFGQKCEKHGQRPSHFFDECGMCVHERWREISMKRAIREREERIEEIAEGFRRAMRGQQ